MIVYRIVVIVPYLDLGGIMVIKSLVQKYQMVV